MSRPDSGEPAFQDGGWVNTTCPCCGAGQARDGYHAPSGRVPRGISALCRPALRHGAQALGRAEILDAGGVDNGGMGAHHAAPAVFPFWNLFLSYDIGAIPNAGGLKSAPATA